jgi:hypothetical protein
VCYLCLRDNPFDVTNDFSNSKTKRLRMMKIKELLNDLEKDSTCDEGEARIIRLKEEQYRLGREL